MKYSKDFIARYIAASCLTKIKGLQRQIDEILSTIAEMQETDDELRALIDSLTLDVDGVKSIIRIIQAQLNSISFLSLTLEEYTELAVHGEMTLYIVTDEADNSVSLYWGDTLIQGGSGGDIEAVWAAIRQIQSNITAILQALNGVSLSPLTLAEYNALLEKDSSTLYIVTDTTDDSVSLYWGDTLIMSGGGGSEYEARIAALENQVTGYTGLTQNPKVNLRWYTRAQYEDIQHDNNTMYVVQNLDSTMQVYVGDTLLNNDGGGAGLLVMVLGVTVPILSALAFRLSVIVSVGEFTPIGGE